MKTIIRYAGGKTRAIKKITPHVQDYDTIISPFLGGGSLEVHWATMGKKVIAADIFSILTTFWNELLENNINLANEMKKLNPNSETYKRVKENLIETPQVQEMLKGWKTGHYKRTPVGLSDVKLAAYYYFNHQLSYGPGFLGWPSKVYLKEDKWNKMIENVLSFSCPNLEVKNQNFEETINEANGEFLYLDPPYHLSKDGDNKMFAGIYPMRNIPVHHNDFEHKKLRDLLVSYPGDFVLSYNDCAWVREAYKDFDFKFPEWHYSLGQGETRIGSNREDSHVKKSHEILIIKK
jgi:DNA adenine methylase